MKLEEKDIYKALFESAGEGLIVTDKTGIIQLVNPRTQELFGYKSEELTGQSIEMLIPQKYRSNHTSHRESYTKDPHRRSMGLGLELYGLKKEGTQFPVEISLNYIKTGEDMLIMALVTDITQRKKIDDELKQVHIDLKSYAEELEASNKELEQFAYVASHDLQEPLRMVSSYTQLLARRYKDQLDEDANEFIHYAVDGASRMQKLINDLLIFSRVGTREQIFTETDFNEILKTVLLNLSVAIHESDAEIITEKLPTIKADSLQITQLFQNLIANAIKFRKKDTKPVIKINAIDENTHWLFSIEDNGIGIDKKYQDRVFMIFQRLHTRHEYKGSGIGLSIARKITERHSGKIRFESEPGKGTTFYFTISKKLK